MYSNKMSFATESMKVYKPIKVLFGTPMYDQALQLCWHSPSYKSVLLRLQRKHQLKSAVTAENMSELLAVQRREALRVQHPRIIKQARMYARILTEQQQKGPESKLLCPMEVVLEVVPNVLQGFWLPPPSTSFNMPSQQVSKMAVGVTKAVQDWVSKALSSMLLQATFSSSIRDNMVVSIQGKVRRSYPEEVLVKTLNCFGADVLNTITNVAVQEICALFQSQTSQAVLTSSDEPPAHTASLDPDSAVDSNPPCAPTTSDEPLAHTASPEPDLAVVSTPPCTPTTSDEPLAHTASPEPDLAVVSTPPCTPTTSEEPPAHTVSPEPDSAVVSASSANIR
ncbi:hypothetical protein GBF38_011550 [Nibea albiflora]|uniref:Uncharacterized protein n=1 Tax=Nibea albiflora TaxID=240163 RepID=A0ACB7F3F3_NIBAL|nr:hypothetical protein GBF38_011550 [Nibea albiflora]